MTRPQATRESTSARPGLIARWLARIAGALRWLLLSLVLSIVIEWIGIAFWWPEEGLAHSRRMLERELSYLDGDYRDSLLTPEPARFAQRLSDRTHYWLFETTRLDRAGGWLERAASTSEHPTVAGLRRLYPPLADGIAAAGQVVQLFMVRLAILILATPVFALFGVVGLVDGLVQRDLRRWGGGRESSYLYHYAKRSVGGFLIAAWVIYLALPMSVNPALVVIPFALLLAGSIRVTASQFKKYL